MSSTVKHGLFLLSFLLLIIGCTQKKNSEKSPEELSSSLFEGNYKVGDYEAIVYSMHRTFEIEMQIFAQPMMFYFDKLDDEGNYIYLSDDQSMRFSMKPDHKSGTFYEINEAPLPVSKE
ncbi:hypothetical protein [Reichenbachiella ulvae]|uniref:Uncharacterized protein n=1 Tax=Reichenbachiella ulvae TaxID=2980104 RepID=A0ABT3CNA7_9BACT|nr:hypothetical protein [Reichenbachiella ulvae]MCV9385161.1 hypothetical protein [Reichenbachiella ulvae]